MNARTALLPVALATAALLTAAAPAGASTATYDDAGALHYVAAPGEKNNLSIQSTGEGASARLTLMDATGVVARGPAGRCDNDWYDSAVNCDMPTALYVELGDGDDRATVSWDLAGGLPMQVAGGPGADWIAADYKGIVPAVFDGGEGNDKLEGGPAADVLHGGAGTDDLSGSGGPDQLYGDGGDDLLSGDGYKTPAADVLDGGDGYDTIESDWNEMTSTSTPGPLATVTLAGGADDGRPGEGDDVRGVEHLELYASGSFTGTGQADKLVVNRQSQDSTMLGLGGDDELVTSEGNDTLDGGAGNDRLDAGFGDDHVVGGPGRDRIFGDHPGGDCGPLWCRYPYGNDVIEARDGEVDQIDCGAGEDRVVADAADVVGADCETVERGGAPEPKPEPKPTPSGKKLRISASAVTVAKALKGKLALKLTVPGAGRLKLQVLRGRALVATTSGTVEEAGAYTATARPSAAGKRALRKKGRVKLTLRATFTPAQGAAVKATGTVTLKR